MIQNLFSLQGCVALVTGGNGGLGRAMALGLRSAGATVAVTGRNPLKNEANAEELGDPSAVFSLDVRDEDSIVSIIAAVVQQFGKLDVLVNNADYFREVRCWSFRGNLGIPSLGHI
jgi:2-dehydro-3-deoxy-D-gluconate 5-dehydrogenase